MNTKLLKQRILDLAIHGRLVPQNPDDEPASQLLRRISEEKEKLIAQGKIKRPKKSDAVNPAQECPFEIPSSWEWVRLGEICEIFGRIGFRGYTKNDLVESDGAITLSPSNIVDGKMDYTKCTYISWEKYEESPEIQIQNGDILLVKTGSSYGKCSLVSNLPQKATINPQFVTLKYISINSKYLTYTLQGNYARKRYEDFVMGTAIPTFTQASLCSLKIPLPPLAEQTRIVSAIEKWFSLIDEIETNKESLQAAIKQTKSKVLDLAIKGKLLKKTDEWKMVTLDTVCKLADGKKQQGTALKYLDVKFLRGKNDGEIITSGKFVPANSMMILVDGENSGEIFTSPIDGYQGSTFKLLDISEEISKPFLLYIIKSYQKQFRENKVGSAIPHLNKKMFKELEIPLPPLSEQTRIVSKIEEILGLLDEIEKELE